MQISAGLLCPVRVGKILQNESKDTILADIFTDMVIRTDVSPIVFSNPGKQTNSESKLCHRVASIVLFGKGFVGMKLEAPPTSRAAWYL